MDLEGMNELAGEWGGGYDNLPKSPGRQSYPTQNGGGKQGNAQGVVGLYQ